MTSTDFHVEAIDRLCFVCGFIIMKNGHHILLVLKEATSLTFERSINLLENVTSSNIMSQLLDTEFPGPFVFVRNLEFIYFLLHS